MATLYCPNCSCSLGKDKENTVDTTCDNCGAAFFNQYGYITDQEHYEEVKKEYPDKRLPLPDND
jgi:hypothetical protein